MEQFSVVSRTVRKPKSPPPTHVPGESSDGATATTGISSDSCNTGSSSRATTSADELECEEDQPLMRGSPANASNGHASVIYRRGDDIQIAAAVNSQPATPPINVTNSPASLGSWLDDLSMGQYKDTFTRNGCTSLEQVLQLTTR